MAKSPSDPVDIDPILAAVQHSLGEGMLTNYICIAEWIDSDGDKRTYSAAMEDQVLHETLGLLDWAQAVFRHRAAQSWDEDDG